MEDYTPTPQCEYLIRSVMHNQQCPDQGDFTIVVNGPSRHQQSVYHLCPYHLGCVVAEIRKQITQEK